MPDHDEKHVVDPCDLPDPSGPPQPTVHAPSLGEKVGVAALRFVGAGAVVLTLVAINNPPLLGSTRSAKLEWQRRQGLIEEAVAANAAEQSEPSPDSLRNDE